MNEYAYICLVALGKQTSEHDFEAGEIRCEHSLVAKRMVACVWKDDDWWRLIEYEMSNPS